MSRSPNRSSGSGVREVFVYNWPKYAAGAVAASAGWAASGRLSGWPRLVVRAGAGLAAGWLTTSTTASWWVYDRSELHSFSWLADLLPRGPGKHLVVSSGLDEASRPLAERYPAAEQRIADLYDPALTTEGSIRRARTRMDRLAAGRESDGSGQPVGRPVQSPPPAMPAKPGALPAATASQDTVFLSFAAHELRRPADREALFAECARVLRPGGTLVLVEHLRNAANAAVFGPGAWHFFPGGEWRRLADRAGLRPVAERRIATFVTAFAFGKEAG